MTIFQILATLFALLMIYLIRLYQKRINFSLLEGFFWYCIWILFIIIALFPNLLINVVHFFKFARVFDLLTVLTFMFLTIIIIASYFTQRENSKKITEFIRKEAINNAKKK